MTPPSRPRGGLPVINAPTVGCGYRDAMLKLLRPIAVALALLAGACVTTNQPPLAGTFVLRPAMQQRLNPAVLNIQQATHHALGDDGRIDPSRLDAGQWQQLALGAEQLAALGHDMAAARDFIAAPPDNAEVRTGEPPMAEVQWKIDRDPYLFRQMSAAMATHADKLAAAARARDGAATRSLLAGTDAVCASCHARFWRPD